MEVKTDFVPAIEEARDNPLQGIHAGGIAKQSFYQEYSPQPVFPEDSA